MMKKKYLPLVILLAGLPACGRKKVTPKPKKTEQKAKSNTASNVDIPLAENGESVRSFFDSDVNDFFAQDAKAAEAQKTAQIAKADENNVVLAENTSSKFSKVYFKFDQYAVKGDQKEVLDHDMVVAQQTLDKARAQGTVESVIFVVEGHACHSAGSDIYNVALSEKRAKAIADYFVANGVPRTNIQTVGRGSEMPEMINGKAVTGDRNEQALNRRSEIRIMQS
jgi:outer membrane protein OmpA-like peptidoglycan-associated protein